MFARNLKFKNLELSLNNFLFAFAIFSASFSVRLLTRLDNVLEAGNVQSTVVGFYRQFARYLVQDGFLSLFDINARVSNL